MPLAELRQQILRALDGAGNELWEEHHIDREDPRVALRSEPTAVDLDGVVHCLKRVEREPDGENDAERRRIVRPVEYLGYRAGVGVQEVEILEGREHPH